MNKLDFLKEKITTEQEVYIYIHKLNANDLLYHFDDDAKDIDFDPPQSDEVIKLLDKRNYDMWHLLGVKGYDLVFRIALDLIELNNGRKPV